MAENNRDSVVSTGRWLLFFILMCIPIVNIIVVLVEAFGHNSNRNIQSYCRALLLWMLLGIAMVVLTVVMFRAQVTKFIQNFDITNIEQTMKNMQQLEMQEKGIQVENNAE